MEALKTCTRCKEEKKESEFGRNSRYKNGLQPHCKECQNEANRKFSLLHPQSVKRSAKKYYDTHKEQERERNRLWVRNNPEKTRIKNQRSKERHPEKIREWKLKNPEKVKEINASAKHNRRAQKINSGGRGFTQSEWSQTKADYSQLCVYCNERKPLQIEHVVPLSRGGRHELENIVPACKNCNASKRSTPLIIWMYRKVTG